MGKSLKQYIAEREIDEADLAERRERILAEARAFRLRELRELYHLTQTDLAATLEVSQRRISKIEHGDIEHTQVDTLRRYVEALGGTLKIEVEVGEQAFQIA